MELPAPTKKTWWYDEYATLAQEAREETLRMEMANSMHRSLYSSPLYPGDISIDANYNYGVAVSSSSSAIISPMISDTAPSVATRISAALHEAGNNMLQATEKNSIEGSIAIIGEDEFKARTKKVLGALMTDEIIKKTKFTLLKDPIDQTVTTRARVYVFSESELKSFIEKVLKIA